MPHVAARVRLAALAQVDGAALDGVDDPRSPVHLRLPELLADLRHLTLVDAALDLAAVGVLVNPHDLALDAGVRRRAASLPDGLRVVGRLLAARDLAKGEPQLLRRRI